MTVAVPALSTMELTVVLPLIVKSKLVIEDVQIAVLEAMLHDTSYVLKISLVCVS